MLIGEDVTPAGGWLHCPDPSDVHTIPDPEPELPHKHGQVEREGISWRIKLTADLLEQELGFITQQRVPVMTQVELSVVPSCVDLVDANELPVPGISSHTKQRGQQVWFRSLTLHERVWEASQSYLLVKEAARPGVPLQDDVVSFSLGKEVSHLQPCRPGPKHAVIIAAGAIALVVIYGAGDEAIQDEKQQTRETRIHNLLDTRQLIENDPFINQRKH